MIVSPDFPDHWKTVALANSLEDPAAAIYVIRLWGHCQTRKTHRFRDLSATALKAICRFSGAHEQLWLSMQEAGFIRVKGQMVTVHQWDAYNSSLVTAWSNGRKGGRPKKKTEKPTGKPEDNPQVTVRGGDKIGLDRIGEDRNINLAPAAPSIANEYELRARPKGEPTQTDSQLPDLLESDQSERLEPDQTNSRKGTPLEVPHKKVLAPGKPARARDPLFDALAEACGNDLTQMPTKARRACGVALAEIRAVMPGLEPAEIKRRALAYTRKYRDAALTPHALAAHWAEFSPPRLQPAPVVLPTPEPVDWEERLPDEDDDLKAFGRGSWQSIPQFYQARIVKTLNRLGALTPTPGKESIP